MTPEYRPLRVAFADPPYIGMSGFYKGHPDYGGEVDHTALLRRLKSDYPDGWVLCLSSTTLERVLLCAREAGLSQEGRDYRIGAWTKPFAVFKPGVNPGYAWEPVLFSGGRKRSRTDRTVRDWCSVNASVLGAEFKGAKPVLFCYWCFDLLGLRPEDTLVDLFPGSGAVSAAWDNYVRDRTGEPRCKQGVLL